MHTVQPVPTAQWPLDSTTRSSPQYAPLSGAKHGKVSARTALLPAERSLRVSTTSATVHWKTPESTSLIQDGEQQESLGGYRTDVLVH